MTLPGFTTLFFLTIAGVALLALARQLGVI